MWGGGRELTSSLQSQRLPDSPIQVLDALKLITRQLPSFIFLREAIVSLGSSPAARLEGETELDPLGSDGGAKLALYLRVLCEEEKRPAKLSRRRLEA